MLNRSHRVGKGGARQYVDAVKLFQLIQRRALMHRDMVGLIALDLILRLFFAGTVHVPFVIHVLDVDP